MADLGKCMVKGCERPAERASVAILGDGLAIPCVVCQQHLAEGETNYEKLYGKPKKRGRHGKAEQ